MKPIHALIVLLFPVGVVADSTVIVPTDNQSNGQYTTARFFVPRLAYDSGWFAMSSDEGDDSYI